MINPEFRNELVPLILKHKMIDSVNGIDAGYIVTCMAAYQQAVQKGDTMQVIESITKHTQAQRDEIIPEPIVESTQEEIVDPEAHHDVPFEGNDHSNDGAVELSVIDEELDPEILKVIDETPVPEEWSYEKCDNLEDVTNPNCKLVSTCKLKLACAAHSIHITEEVITEVKEKLKNPRLEKRREEIKANIDHVDDRFDKEGWITYNKALASTDNFIKRSYIKKLIRLYPDDTELPSLLEQWK